MKHKRILGGLRIQRTPIGEWSIIVDSYNAQDKSFEEECESDEAFLHWLSGYLGKWEYGA